MRQPHAFQQISLLIAEGHIEQALAALDEIQVQDPEQKREVAYLRAWIALLRDRWDEAAGYLLPQEISGEIIKDLQELGRTERRRRIYYLLVMGDVAADLQHYEQAIDHYTWCLRFLNERRMNDPTRRIRTLLGLGRSYLETDHPAHALEYYQQALRLCQNPTYQLHLPQIYDGLSRTYIHLEQLDCALEYGKQALRLATERGEKDFLCQIGCLLGDIYCQMGNLEAANASYTEALGVASMESIEARVTCLLALAELRMQENKREDAWHYCEIALASRHKVSRLSLLRRLYTICGKVKEAQARQCKGQEEQEAIEQALSFYEQAIETLKSADRTLEMAETYGQMAHLLEGTGRPERALALWKQACLTLQRE
jgi:tetratricopeptide (TPR) repeat protein